LTAPETSTLELTALLREHGGFVARVLHRMVAEADVDDAWQEVFVVVHTKLGEFEGRSSVRTWLYGICFRTAAAFRRKAPVRREIPTEDLPEVPVLSTPEKELGDREALSLLDQAVMTLDDDKKHVFLLYEVEELTMAEVAEIVGCPLQTAYSRHKAAREIVMAYFRRHGGTP
jgi:RNA polymerase sigma-70 factor, ECF subfamily